MSLLSHCVRSESGARSVMRAEELYTSDWLLLKHEAYVTLREYSNAMDGIP